MAPAPAVEASSESQNPTITPVPVKPTMPMEAPTTVPEPTEPPATVPPPAEESAGSFAIELQQISLNTQGLPYSWQAVVVPATPYDQSMPPGPMGLPTHIEILFGVTDPADRQFGDPVMYIIPVDPYRQMWNDAGSPADLEMANTFRII